MPTPRLTPVQGLLAGAIALGALLGGATFVYARVLGLAGEVEATSPNAGFMGFNATLAFRLGGQVDDVLAAGPAFAAGLRKGDVVEAVDGEAVPEAAPGGPKDAGTASVPVPGSRMLRLAGAPGVVLDQVAWSRFGGARGTTAALKVRGKGELRVARALALRELEAAWHAQRRAEARERVEAARRAVTKLEAALAAAVQGLTPPAWLPAAWEAKAAAAVDPLALLAGGPEAGVAQAARAALVRRDHAAYLKATDDEDVLLEACVADPRTMALPPHLHDLRTIAAIAEAGRLARRGDLAGALAAAKAGEGEGEMSYSTDDPRFGAAAAAIADAVRSLDGSGDALARARNDLAAAEKYLKETDFDAGVEFGTV
jgi:hypothetical protein